MKYSYQQNLRRTLLQEIYERSGGDHFTFVMRQELADKLGFHYNDSRLHAGLKYLKDKYLVEYRSNVADSITTDGIDEAENGYPSLPGYSIFENDQAFSQFLLTNVLTVTGKLLDKDKKGLVKSEELHSLITEVIIDTREGLKKMSEEDRLMFEKITPSMQNLPKTGIFLNAGEAKNQLQKYIDFIESKLEEMTGEPHKTETYIQTGKSFSARSYLRKIFRIASDEIFIIDTYPGIEILDILHSIFEDNQNLKLKILISDKVNNKKTRFIKELQAFSTEYTNNTIECRETNANHDRYILLDKTEIYHSGNSFDNVCKANKASHISKIDDQDEVGKYVVDIQNWWSTGSKVV